MGNTGFSTESLWLSCLIGSDGYLLFLHYLAFPRTGRDLFVVTEMQFSFCSSILHKLLFEAITYLLYYKTGEVFISELLLLRSLIHGSVKR